MLKHKCRVLTLIFCVVVFPSLPLVAEAKVPGRLKVSDNHRYLQYENGQPFFYLGDTAWELIHRLNREEATEYLTNRAHKGFTVIQTVAIAPADGLISRECLRRSSVCLIAIPPNPMKRTFAHVDFVVNKAEELGMFVGLLPTWGSYWASGKSIFNATTARAIW